MTSFPRAAALVAVAILAAGCGRAPAPDLTADYADVDRVRAEVLAFGPDSTAQALLDAADASRRAAAAFEAAKDPAAASRALVAALATNRVALAATGAAFRETGADECERSAADARREWQDAVHLLEQAEKIAGRTMRGVVRTLDDETPESEDDPAWALPLPAEPRAADVDAALKRAAELKTLARDRRVASSDLEGIRLRAMTAADDPEATPEVREANLLVAARAVEELAQRLRSDAADRRCRDALALSRAYSGYRDHALWSMVELERGMKEGLRQELDAERARMEDRQTKLYEALQQFEGKFASIRQEARGTIMSLSDILFDFDKATLKRDAEFNLVRVSTILQQFPEMHIYIEGHTDNIGTEEYNKKLSERRAQAVFDFLGQQGVDPARMDWFGYGMSQPVESNATDAGRAKNRRVDLVIGE